MSKRAELFLSALAGVEDPEAKRKTIGRLFIETFEARGEKDRRRRPRSAANFSRRARSIQM